jgi:tetratricopeptide (TPR) repeat protein
LANLAQVIVYGSVMNPDAGADGDTLFAEAAVGEITPSSDAGGEAALSTADLASASGRRALDAFLVARRALALAPRDPRVRAIAATIAGLAGELDQDREWFRELGAIERLHRFHALVLLSHYRRQAAALEAAGDAGAATVLNEASYVLAQAALGRADRGTLERLARAGLVAEGQIILARGSEWAYLDDGTDPGQGWKDPAFDDEAWLRGPARLGYGGDGEKTVVRFGPNPREKHITTYFRAAFDVADPGRFQQVKLSVLRDDGVVVYLNGQEIARDNMPAGEVGPQTTAQATVNDEGERKFFVFDVTAALRSGKNVVAAEVHQQEAGSSDLGFDLELEGLGAIKEPTRDPDALEAIEARLDLLTEIRSAMWVARAERARLAGDLERAAKGLDRAARLGPGNPGVLHERALLQFARGDVDAAARTYVEAAEAAIALKAGPRSSWTLLLPGTLKAAVEPIVQPTGVAVAAAARRLARVSAPTRDIELRWLLAWSAGLDREGHDARLERAEAQFAFGQIEAVLAAVDGALAAGPPPAGAPPRQIRERVEWLSLRERCMRRLGRSVGADLVRDEMLAPPPRDPSLGPNPTRPHGALQREPLRRPQLAQRLSTEDARRDLTAAGWHRLRCPRLGPAQQRHVSADRHHDRTRQGPERHVREALPRKCERHPRGPPGESAPLPARRGSLRLGQGGNHRREDRHPLPGRRSGRVPAGPE